jgi:hypothetical protein
MILHENEDVLHEKNREDINLKIGKPFNIMAFPFKVTNPTALKPGESMTLTDEDIKSIKKQNEALLKIRGKVISAALITEQQLDDLISILMMGIDNDARNQFKEMILNKEFFTFMNKWKTLRDFLNRKAIVFAEETERKEFLNELHQLIEIRDIFAHGEIIFSGTIPQLHFSKEGEKRYLILNDEYFDGLNELFSKVNFTLENLFKFVENRIISTLEKENSEDNNEITEPEKISKN